MTRSIDPRRLNPDAHYFLDYIEHRASATDLFQHTLESASLLAEARQSSPTPQVRLDVCDTLLTYNRRLDASDETLASIHQLRDPRALCVIGGQQACFLGGPLFVIYKIASVIRTAQWMSSRLHVPVVPMFWLASEDHDFEEINHTRWLDPSGTLQTLHFEWEHQGQAIETLPITSAVRHAFDELKQRIPFQQARDASLFSPEDGDDYCSWHARIWSRMFSQHGLILVEPRVLRPLATSFFSHCLSEARSIRDALKRGASALEDRGYSIPLNPERAGTLFTLSATSKRQRVEQPDSAEATRATAHSATLYSTDAALRPLLADSLLPNVANVLGPSELQYHAMLRWLYEQWDIPQPLAIPRHGATVISSEESRLLANAELDIAQLLEPQFAPVESVKHLVPTDHTVTFEQAGIRVEEALHPLKEHLSQLDPGLEARWRQTLDQVKHQLDRLEDRAMRVELARRGISVKQLTHLVSLVRPMGKPQERILSCFSFIAAFGVEWIHDMTERGESDRFEHRFITL